MRAAACLLRAGDKRAALAPARGAPYIGRQARVAHVRSSAEGGELEKDASRICNERRGMSMFRMSPSRRLVHGHASVTWRKGFTFKTVN